MSSPHPVHIARPRVLPEPESDQPVVYLPKALVVRAQREGIDLDKLYAEYGATWAIDEPMPTGRRSL